MRKFYKASDLQPAAASVAEQDPLDPCLIANLKLIADPAMWDKIHSNYLDHDVEALTTFNTFLEIVAGTVDCNSRLPKMKRMVYKKYAGHRVHSFYLTNNDTDKDLRLLFTFTREYVVLGGVLPHDQLDKRAHEIVSQIVRSTGAVTPSGD